ncbi:MAG: thioredoxin domain-containing protein [Campylobacterales bacterium]|nr:thioredoxin domain-containing protein [Campylobacterales bacterium]
MANRLKDESSAYLQQHSNNPIDWYPWGNEALTKAKKENKPLFVSIGYSSCHWCHVMAHESFEDKKIATLLNENFVAIKVDKEERPDIDKYFQDIYALMNGRSGGWPTSIFLTPNLKPFYAGTYIPKTPKYGMMAFEELLQAIIKKYKKDSELLEQKGKEVLNFLNPKKENIEATKIDKTLISRFSDQAKHLYDEEFGGFGNEPKFPQTSIYMTLLEIYKLRKDKEILNLITHSLRSMANGGLHDLIDGGFCRYSTTRDWLIPHFEKMTYDNALLIRLYSEVYLTVNDNFFKEIALKSIDFMLQYMSKDHLFFSASDADTDGIEGAYFTYDYGECFQVFTKEGFTLGQIEEIFNALDITRDGNFEGKSIINIKKNLDVKMLQKALKVLRLIRKQKRYPFIDIKIITSWNAMMIESLFVASLIDEKYSDIAQKSLDALLKKLYKKEKLYHTVVDENQPHIEAFLEDYAHLASALIKAYEITAIDNYLALAIKLSNQAIKEFYTDKQWHFSNGAFKTKDERYDTSYPSASATMLFALLKLDLLCPYDYGSIIDFSLRCNSYDLMRQPISSPLLTQVAITQLFGMSVIKSNKENITQHMTALHLLPFTIVTSDAQEGYSACDRQSCFAHEATLEKIIGQINKKLL